MESKLDGVLLYIAEINSKLLARFIFQLIEGEKGRSQLNNRDWGDGNNRTRKRQKRTEGVEKYRPPTMCSIMSNDVSSHERWPLSIMSPQTGCWW